jgi:predicted Zn-dependent protease
MERGRQGFSPMLSHNFQLRPVRRTPPVPAEGTRLPMCRRPSFPGVLALLLGLWVGAAGCGLYHARSPGERISYEEKIGKEFALEASSQLRLMDEPEILDFSKRLGKRLASNVYGSPYTYKFFVVRNPTMNAFAVPGGYVYVFAGLLSTVETEDELAAVLAHEISHVEGNHFIRGQKKLDAANIAAAAAMILAATLGGGQQAAAVGTLAQATQITTALHYSREFEREADRGSISLLRASGFDTKGILTLFERFQSQARLNAADLPPYFYTHPLPMERLYEVRSWIEATPSPAARKAPIRGFDIAKATARLRIEEQQEVLASLEDGAVKHPSDARAQFLPGYVYLKIGNLTLALPYLEKALNLDPSQAEHAMYLGRAHCLAGRLDAAEEFLAVASRLEPDNSILEVFLGDLAAQRGKTEEALRHYERAVAVDPDSSFAEANLAMAYGRGGLTGKSYLHLALAYKNAGEYLKSLYYFKKARRLLDKNSKDAKLAEEQILWFEG